MGTTISSLLLLFCHFSYVYVFTCKYLLYMYVYTYKNWRPASASCVWYSKKKLSRTETQCFENLVYTSSWNFAFKRGMSSMWCCAEFESRITFNAAKSWVIFQHLDAVKNSHKIESLQWVNGCDLKPAACIESDSSDNSLPVILEIVILLCTPTSPNTC